MLHFPDNKLPSQVAAIMLKAMNKEQGMVAGLASLLETLDNDPDHADGKYSVLFHKVPAR